MKFNIDFSQQPKLFINGIECDFNQEIKGSTHQTNKSHILLKDVHWKDYTPEERMEKPFIVPTYSIAKLYFGESLFFHGIAIAQAGGSLSPFVRKHSNIKIISIDTFLSEGKFMDFVIIDEEPEKVVDRIIKKLNIPSIKKGEIHFQDKIHIKSYNLQDKTAYAGLDIVAKQTNSTMIFGLDENENITINFYSRDYLEKHNTGTPIDFSSEESKLNFWNAFDIRDMQQKEINVRTSNLSRMYSDSVLSTKQQTKVIDLSAIKDNEITRFNIGKILSAELTQTANDAHNRTLIAITEKQNNLNKQGDVVYGIKSNSLSFKNDFGLLNLNVGIITIVYLPIVSFSHQTENKEHQKMILKNSGLEGELTRVEKRNDLSEATDIIAQNEEALSKYSGIHKSLDITSGTPIWEVGQSTEFISTEDSYSELVGNYKVKQIDFEFTLNDSFGLLKNSVFKYKLIKSFDFETGINFYDTKQYKQNNAFSEDTFETKTFETAEVVVSSDSVFECVELGQTPGLENEVELNLQDFDLDIKVITT